MCDADRSLWVEDRYALRCEGCGQKFTLFRRRHHCRLCGQVFCSDCLHHPLSYSGAQRQSFAGSFSNPVSKSCNALDEKFPHVDLPSKVCKRCGTTVTTHQHTSVEKTSEHLYHLSQSTTEGRHMNLPSLQSSLSLKTCEFSRMLGEPSEHASAVLAREGRQTTKVQSGCVEDSDGNRRTGNVEEPEKIFVPHRPRCTIPLQHTETDEEKSISYGIGEAPVRYQNSLRKWLAKQLCTVGVTSSAIKTDVAPLWLSHSHRFSLTTEPIVISAWKDKETTSFVISFAEPILLPHPYYSTPHPIPPHGGKKSIPMQNGDRSLYQVQHTDDLHRLWESSDAQEWFAMHWLRRMLSSSTFAAISEQLVPEGITRDTKLVGDNNMQNRLAWAVPWLQAINAVTARVLSNTVVALGGHVYDHIEVVTLTSHIDEFKSETKVDSQPACQIDIIFGVALKRSLVSKRMPSFWENPRILFLSGHVSYKMQSLSLSEYVDSYKGHLDKLLHRILVWAPQVIVVESGMHHYLQKRITDTGTMSLVLNVGSSMLTRLASCCGATVVHDLQYITVSELQNERTPLGRCGVFRVAEVNRAQPSLCIFEQLPTSMFSTLVFRRPPPRSSEPNYDKIQRWLMESLATGYHAVSQGYCLRDLGMAVYKLSHISGVCFDQSTQAVKFIHPDGLNSFLRPQERCPGLSLNHGVRFGDAVIRTLTGEKLSADAYHRLRDRIDVQCIALDILHSHSISALTVDDCQSELDCVSATSVDPCLPPELASTRRLAAQKLCTYVFYQKEKDLTVLGFLVKHTRERLESRVMMCHARHRILISKSLATERCELAESSDESSRKAFLDAQSQSLAFKHGSGEKDRSSRFILEVIGYFSKPPACYIECPSCVDLAHGKGDGQISPRLCYLSNHTLNLSLGSLLELLFNAHTSLQHLACAQAMNQKFSICFVCDPPSPHPAVLIRLDVEPLDIYHLRLRCCPSQSQAIEKEAARSHQPELPSAIENDDIALERCELYSDLDALESALSHVSGGAAVATSQVTTFSATLKSATSSIASHSNLRTGLSCSFPFLSSLSVASSLATEPFPQSSQALQLRVERLMQTAAQLSTVAQINHFRWNELRGLIKDVKEWYQRNPAAGAQHVLKEIETEGATRRLGPNVKPLMNIENRQWWFSPVDQLAVRADEPTSFIRVALARLYGVSGTTPAEPVSTPDDLAADAEVLPMHPDQSGGASTHHYPSTAATTSGTCVKISSTQEKVPETMEDGEASMAATKSTHAACDWPVVETDGSLVGIPRTAEEAYKTLMEASRVKKSPDISKQPSKHRIMLNELASSSGVMVGSAVVDVFFPASFAALQYMFFQNPPQQSLLRSLARCSIQSFQGGKSSAKFYRTWDGLLLKRIKWMEMKHFVMSWGPEYFGHMARYFACQTRTAVTVDQEREWSSQPSKSNDVLLATVLGLYAIQINRKGNSQESGHTKGVGETQYYMLMENLTQHTGVHVDKTFDLKGSQRNRTALEGSSVKLDADLVEQIRNGSFFFCTSAQKHLLMETLRHDTQLLSCSDIMDYSLLAAMDVSRRELLLGLIDFMHPYTGAKLLESRVKSSLDTVLGYSGRDPTIIGPPDYKERFLRYMNTYFCGIPDKLFALVEEPTHDEDRLTTSDAKKIPKAR